MKRSDIVTGVRRHLTWNFAVRGECPHEKKPAAMEEIAEALKVWKISVRDQNHDIVHGFSPSNHPRVYIYSVHYVWRPKARRMLQIRSNSPPDLICSKTDDARIIVKALVFLSCTG